MIEYVAGTATAFRTAPPEPTPFEQADTIASALSKRKAAWVQVSLPDRIAYLRRCIAAVAQVAEKWAEAACMAKGIEPTASLAGEEWLVGPTVTLSNLQQLIKTLQANGQPKPAKIRLYQPQTNQPQTIAQVLPNHWTDRVLWQGFTGEVWMEPGMPAAQGMVYRNSSTAGKLALVLGAGNISSIGPMDVLYKLFAEDAVVLLKMNPVNEYMGPILETVFAPLRQAGFLEIVYGGADLGRYLCQHPLVDTIHITGSQHTHDAIVWGDASEQAQRKATNQPITAKPITSELGCVTPILVVPGDWSKADMAFQARHIAGMVVHNASFNCAAAKVLITAKHWAQRDEFLNQLQQELAVTPLRQAYYPGAQQRYQAFLNHYPQAKAVAVGSDRTIPWTLIPDVPARMGEYALEQEAFCGVLAEVSLEAADPAEFLDRAVTFANETVWGNLSCTMLVDPATQRRWATAIETAIANLRYGAIGVNVWSALIYSLPSLTWGAFPGNPLNNIASGQGVVHNTHLFEHPQKSVLRAPFRITPTPLWFARRQNLLQIAQQFTQFQSNPTLAGLVRVILATVSG